MPSFPASSILDSFDRADENPLSTGWASIGTTNQLKLLSHQAAGIGATNNRSRYTTTAFGNDIESFCTVAVKPETGAFVELWLGLVDGSTDAFDGYRVIFEVLSGPDLISFGMVTNGGFSPIGPTKSVEINVGDTIGGRRTGSILNAYINGVEIITVTDGTHIAGGQIGLGIFSTVGRVVSFGGGAMIPSSALPRQGVGMVG